MVMFYCIFFFEDVDIFVLYVVLFCYGVEDGCYEFFLKMVFIFEVCKKIEDFQLEVLKCKFILLFCFEKYCVGKKYKFCVFVEEIYDYLVFEYLFFIW